jgi:hypothetical protein
VKSQSDLENLLLSLFGNNVSELSRFIQVLPPFWIPNLLGD